MCSRLRLNDLPLLVLRLNFVRSSRLRKQLSNARCPSWGVSFRKLRRRPERTETRPTDCRRHWPTQREPSRCVWRWFTLLRIWIKWNEIHQMCAQGFVHNHIMKTLLKNDSFFCSHCTGPFSLIFAEQFSHKKTQMLWESSFSYICVGKWVELDAKTVAEDKSKCLRAKKIFKNLKGLGNLMWCALMVL